MLQKDQMKDIPKSTRWYWNQFKHDNYYGHEWAEDYIQQFDDIKNVFSRKYLFKTMRLMCRLSDNYNQILNYSTQSKKILKNNAQKIVSNIDHLIKSSLNVRTACKVQSVSYNWYYRQKHKLICSLSPFKICFRQQPNQLSIKEISAIDKAVHLPENFGKTLTTLYYNCLNNNFVICGKTTFFKYAHVFGYRKKVRKPKSNKKGFQATRPYEWLHVDITYVQTIQDGVQKVAFVKDNFSKAILHYKSTFGKAGSEFIRDLFQETFEKYKLLSLSNPINILSDGGPENKGVFLDWINQIIAPPIVTKITASTAEFPFSNSMSESTHSIFKTEFMKGEFSLNAAIHLNDLKKFVEYYNFERYPTTLFGYTPFEVLQGHIPDKHRFKEQISLAKEQRLESNRAYNECSLSACIKE